MIKNGARRRTPGGVYLQLLRDIGPSEKVRLFFASCNNQPKKKKKRAFSSELEEFRKLSQEFKKNKSKKKSEEEEGEALKPLPDILSSCIERKKDLEAFEEPEPPPNSVEQKVQNEEEFESDEFNIEFQ